MTYAVALSRALIWLALAAATAATLATAAQTPRLDATSVAQAAAIRVIERYVNLSDPLVWASSCASRSWDVVVLVDLALGGARAALVRDRLAAVFLPRLFGCSAADASAKTTRCVPCDVAVSLVTVGGEPELRLAGATSTEPLARALFELPFRAPGRGSRAPSAVLEALRVVAGLAEVAPFAIPWRADAQRHVLALVECASDSAAHAPNRVGAQRAGAAPDPLDGDWLAEIEVTAAALAHAEVSASFVVDGRCYARGPVLEQLGDPDADRAYANGRGFSPGATLFAAERAAPMSLQRRLLAAGVWARLVDWAVVRTASGERVWLSPVAMLPPRESPRLELLRQPEPEPEPKPELEPEPPSCGLAAADACSAAAPATRTATFIARDRTRGNTTSRWSARALSTTPVERIAWSPNEPFADAFIRASVPVILTNTTVTLWPALRRWNESYLSEHCTGRMDGVLVAARETQAFLTVDHTQPLVRDSVAWARARVEHSFVNMSQREFWSSVFRPAPDRKAQHFASIDPAVRADAMPNTMVFATPSDASNFLSYFWIGSAGVATHTHIDQDPNFYAQVTGRKTFFLFAPYGVDDMYMFPRLHPLWHKSQADFDAPALERVPLYARAHVFVARLEPGDLLFVPPHWWHNVVSEHASVSLASFSRRERVYVLMNEVHRMALPCDTMAGRPQVVCIRRLVAALVERVVGVGASRMWARLVLRTRMDGVSALYEPAAALPCAATAPMPAAFARQVEVVVEELAARLLALDAETRDVLFPDYVEQALAAVVGARHAKAELECLALES